MSFFAAFLLCAVPGAFMAFIGVGHLWNYARLRQGDPVPIRELRAPSGALELEGTARAHEDTGRSPFTDTRTLVHEWTVKEYSPSPSSDSSSWSRLASGDEQNSFRLEDDTGTALIDIQGGTPYLQTTTTITVEPDESPPPAIAQFLQSSDEVDREHSHTRRYSESRLDPGAPVHVYGPVRNDAPAADAPIDAIIGVDDADRGFTVGEDSLNFSNLAELFTAEAEQFIVTNAGEREAERQMLNIGLLFSGVGLLFLVVFAGITLL